MTDPSASLATDAAHKATPSMAQYLEIKAVNQDSLLFYRMGDFYELFFGDAEIAARALGIVLTKRGRHGGEDIPMCGVPVVRADDYLQRLIGLGHRVAVCEQLEDPAEARKRGSKAVVRRDVVRLVTPGTVTEENLLDPSRASLLVAVARRKLPDETWLYGVAAVDISTGRFTVAEAPMASLAVEIARLEPREIVLPDALYDDADLKPLWRDARAAMTPLARDGLDPASAERRLKEYFGVATLDAFGSFSRCEVAAAAMALAYVERTQLGARAPLLPPRRDAIDQVMRIDAATRANLELTRTLGGERQGSLIQVIDRTRTPGGARLLIERLSSPLTDVAAIAARHDAVELFVSEASLHERLRDILGRVPDVERAFGRLSLDRGGPRDLYALANGLQAAVGIARQLADLTVLPDEIAAAGSALAGVDPDLAGELLAALSDDLPLMARDGGFIREGHRAELDELRELQTDSRRIIAVLQGRYASQTGVKSLRIKHNNVLGYFIEVPQAAGEAFMQEPHRATFVHRQTMAGAMRFTTVELGDLQDRISSAADRAVRLELSLFAALRDKVLAAGKAIGHVAAALALIDVSTALAALAVDYGWVRPGMDGTDALVITGGRHPVVEMALKRDGQPFVANDCDLTGEGGGRITLLTGPNMAGKSTYLRQTALIVILAQMGAFVPAAAARIGVVDRLFSRVGAADDLARGRSTFMVEMVETAAILNQAGPRALVILDEIGRGTSTFDGLSIAWSAIEHLHEVNRCRALFATHFHELTALADKWPRIVNATVRVTEWNGDVVFLHEVVPGAADRSYGIQVAKLAGLPPAVVERARILLAELEKSEREKPVAAIIDDLPLFSVPVRQAPPAARQAPDALRVELAAIEPDELTPRQALEALYRLKLAARG
ncbi:MAG: DNA mismatch repair protein MutS [Hyphomicrobiales bacterium]|nr:DNA mismatch repair protein MutS [Hyphomicrobiales bacterium]